MAVDMVRNKTSFRSLYIQMFCIMLKTLYINNLNLIPLHLPECAYYTEEEIRCIFDDIMGLSH